MAVSDLERRRKQHSRGKKKNSTIDTFNNVSRSTLVVTMTIVMTMMLVVQPSSTSSFIQAFQLSRPISAKSTFTSTTTTTTLWMGKLRNKQAELQRKMEAAKKARMQEEKGQNEESSSLSSSKETLSTSSDRENDSTTRLSDEEMKELNDRKRFEQLLSSSIAMSRNDGEGGYDDDDETDGYNSRRRGDSDDVDMSLTYLSINQEEENIDAYSKLVRGISFICFGSLSCYRKQFFYFIILLTLTEFYPFQTFFSARGVERFFEGDTAPENVFEELVAIKSENAIGETGKKRLLPWLRGKDDDYLVVICDPRQKSPDFRDTVKSLTRFLPKDLLKKAVFINADTPAENRRFLKKNNLSTDDGGKITLYSDEKMEWMRSYTALGHDRFSMTLFVLANGRIQKLVRDLSSVNAPQVVESAIKATQKRRL